MAITQRTKVEDDKLRKALENADLKQFEKVMRRGFASQPRQKKANQKTPPHQGH